jgi:dynein heavy chain
MREWQQQYLSDLSQLIIRIQGYLTPLQRKVIIALITTDVHARDIIAELALKQIDDVHNFVWQQQLRYYWLADNDECVIHHRWVSAPSTWRWLEN